MTFEFIEFFGSQKLIFQIQVIQALGGNKHLESEADIASKCHHNNEMTIEVVLKVMLILLLKLRALMNTQLYTKCCKSQRYIAL